MPGALFSIRDSTIAKPTRAGTIAPIAAQRARFILRLAFRFATYLLLAVTLYVVLWSCLYRLPPSAPATIDERPGKSGQPYYITFCAGLANNPLGFPGHAYVVWSASAPTQLPVGESIGYVPAKFFDQVPSLWTHVRGRLARNCQRGNTRNLNRLTVVVDRSAYEKTKTMCAAWDTNNFQAGVKDCVAFANSVALELKLKTPSTSYRFPQDYVSQLKRLN